MFVASADRQALPHQGLVVRLLGQRPAHHAAISTLLASGALAGFNGERTATTGS